jgi:hypothetical protein
MYRLRLSIFPCAVCVLLKAISASFTCITVISSGKCKQTAEQFKKGEVKLGFRGHTSTVQPDGTYEHASPTWTKLATAASLLPPLMVAGASLRPDAIQGFDALDADAKDEVLTALEDVAAIPAGKIPEPYPGPCRCRGCADAVMKKRKSEETKKRKSGEVWHLDSSPNTNPRSFPRVAWDPEDMIVDGPRRSLCSTGAGL